MNQSLVDDGLVDKEKIGGSNYFWSFPAKKDRMNQLAHEETLRRIESLKSAVNEAEARLADAKRGREEDDEGGRAAKMTRKAELSKELEGAARELETLRQNDPREIANLEKELRLVTGGAHRWTDNIFSCKDYLVKKRGMMKKEGESRGRTIHFLVFLRLDYSHLFTNGNIIVRNFVSSRAQPTNIWASLTTSIVSTIFRDDLQC